MKRSKPPLRNERKGRSRAIGLGVESLEGRQLLATLTVFDNADAGPGSLRTAIEQANLDQAPDTIVFDPSVTGTIVLSSSLAGSRDRYHPKRSGTD